MNTGFPGGLAVSHVAVLPGQIYTVFAGTAAGVWKTVNQGSTWSPVALADLSITALAAAPSGRGPIVAGSAAGSVAYSVDSGTTWQALTVPEPDQGVTALAVDPVRPTIWYLGLQGSGVWRTFDAGGNWTLLNEGLADLPVRALRVHPANGGVYAGTEAGVFFLAPSATAWVPRTGGAVFNDVQSLALSAEPEATLLAGTGAGAAISMFPLDAAGAEAGPVPPTSPGGGAGDGGGSLAWPWLAALLWRSISRRGGCNYAARKANERLQ